MIKRYASIVASILVCAFLLVGCGSIGYDSAHDYGGQSPEMQAVSDELKVGTSNYSYSDSAEMSAANNNTAAGVAINRMIIREQEIEQQVQDLKGTLANIEAEVNAIQGAYIESLREWNREAKTMTEHRVQLILRIPQNQFDSFLAHVESQGNIKNRRIAGLDVTEEFIDNASRLRNLNAHEERILQLYEKAVTIEDMLKIEQELSRIRASIEQLEGRQKYLTQVTSTVKLTLELFQVDENAFLSAQEDVSTLTEAWLGFKRSLQDLGIFGQRLFIFLVSALPYLIILGLFIVAGVFLVKRLTKLSKKDENKPTV